jgi:hypothetical protein
MIAYPAAYRRDHESEILDTLLQAAAPGQRQPSLREAVALLFGGLRMRVRSAGQLPSPLWVLAVVVIGVLAYEPLSLLVAPLNRQAQQPFGLPPLPFYLNWGDWYGIPMAVPWILAALAVRRAGWRLLAWFCGLMALEIALVDTLAGLLLVNLYDAGQRQAVDIMPPGWPRFVVMSAELVLRTVVTGAVLKCAGIPWRIGLLVGCALELLVGTIDFSLFSWINDHDGVQALYRSIVTWGDGHHWWWIWVYPPTYLWPLRLAVWAGVLAALISGRRQGSAVGSPQAAATNG